jgi:hypothetical protein
MSTQWFIDGRKAALRDVIESLALSRQHLRRVALMEREAAERDAEARKVGRAIRKALADGRGRFPIGCFPPKVSGTQKSSGRQRAFEQLLGLNHPKRLKPRGGGLSSFHCKFTGRGLGDHRRATGRPYKRGEAVQAVRYILREDARELPSGGIVSNISQDPDFIAATFAAIEELEMAGGRTNATVFMSLVISLPHELEPSQRLGALTEICRPFADAGLPHAGVLHAPDPDGDPRNYHAHVILSWRPFQHEANGLIAFADRTLSERNTPEGHLEFRQSVAEALNAAMAKAGKPRRFTAKSNAARGLKPVSKGEGKSTPGKKHRERRRKKREALEAERDAQNRRINALQKIGAIAQSVKERPMDDRATRLSLYRDLDQQITTSLAEVHAEDARRVTATQAVSHEKSLPEPASSGPIIARGNKQSSVDGAVTAPTSSPPQKVDEDGGRDPSKVFAELKPEEEVGEDKSSRSRPERPPTEAERATMLGKLQKKKTKPQSKLARSAPQPEGNTDHDRIEEYSRTKSEHPRHTDAVRSGAYQASFIGGVGGVHGLRALGLDPRPLAPEGLLPETGRDDVRRRTAERTVGMRTARGKDAAKGVRNKPLERTSKDEHGATTPPPTHPSKLSKGPTASEPAPDLAQRDRSGRE